MQQTEKLFMEHSLLQLRIRYMWPRKGQSRSMWFYFQYFCVSILASPFWLMLAMHLITTIRDHVDIDISADISVLISVLGHHMIVICFIWGHKKIADLFQNLLDFSSFGKPDDFEKKILWLNFCSKFYASYCLSGVIIYFIFKKLQVPQCRRNNEEKHLHEVCGLMTSVWTPIDLDYFPYRELILLLQLIGVFQIINGGAAMSFTTLEIASVIVLQIRHLRKLLEEVFDTLDEEKRKRQLVYCIEYHKHIIWLHDLFDSRYKYCNGIYIVLVGVAIAALANQYMKERNVGVIMHLTGWIINFFICCHAGQILQTESKKISDSAYGSKWYNVSVGLRRILLIIIIKSQKPFHLHGAPIGIMSHELYIKLVKTSTSYFALLNQST